jgi:hypothetical protein
MGEASDGLRRRVDVKSGPDPVPPNFPRTFRSLSLDRSRYTLPLFALAVALLVGWAVWALTARVEVPSLAPAGVVDGAASRPSSPAALLLRTGARAASPEVRR